MTLYLSLIYLFWKSTTFGSQTGHRVSRNLLVLQNTIGFTLRSCGPFVSCGPWLRRHLSFPIWQTDELNLGSLIVLVACFLGRTLISCRLWGWRGTYEHLKRKGTKKNFQTKEIENFLKDRNRRSLILVLFFKGICPQNGGLWGGAGWVIPTWRQKLGKKLFSG